MKTSQLPLLNTTDGSEELVIVRGTGAAKETALLPPGLLVDAAVKPTPAELQAAILAALVAGADIALTQNADGTVSVSIVDSPNFTGTPHAPTADPGTNTTQIATTAFVAAAAAALQAAVNGKQATLEAGTGVTLHDNGDGTFTISATGGGTASALTDGVYGDITVSNGGTKMTVTNVTNGTVTVPDEVYGAAWSGKLSVPTKNALFNQIETVKTSINGKVSSSAVGAASGVASLDATGKVPAAQLPSYVDDVLEFSNSGAFPGAGETGKIYVALDTNAQWRWSGSAYVQLVASPGTTDNVAEGSTNKYYTDVRVRAAVMTGLVQTVGTPAATDSLLTVLGKLYRQAFSQVLPLSAGASNPLTGALIVQSDVTAWGNLTVNNNIYFGTNGGAGNSIYANSASGTVRTFGFLTAGAYAADIALQTDNGTIKHNSGIAHLFTINGATQLTVNSGGLNFFQANVSGANGGIWYQPRDNSAGASIIYSPVSNDLRFNNAAGDILQVTGTLVQTNKVLNIAGFDATYNVGVKQLRSGQVGYHMYNGGSTCEWLTYQPAHASGDDYRIATFVGGVTTDRLKIGPDGTVYTMANTYVAQELWCNGNIVRFGGAGSNHYVWFDGTKYQIPNAEVSAVGGFFSSTGASAGMNFYARDNTAGFFSWYNWGNVLKVYSSTANGDRFTLTANGDGWFNGNITSASDARLKSNIRQLEGGLALATSLRGVRYEKDDSEQVGVIAQEVREVVPEVVREDEEGFLSVDYGRLTAVLIEAVKELSAEVSDLKARLAA